MINYYYTALPGEEIKLTELSPLAIGVYYHLRWTTPKNISQLGVVAPRISYVEIGLALEELIDSGLVSGDAEF